MVELSWTIVQPLNFAESLSKPYFAQLAKDRWCSQTIGELVVVVDVIAHESKYGPQFRARYQHNLWISSWFAPTYAAYMFCVCEALPFSHYLSISIWLSDYLNMFKQIMKQYKTIMLQPNQPE